MLCSIYIDFTLYYKGRMGLSIHTKDHSYKLVKRNSLKKIVTTDTSVKCMDAVLRTSENIFSRMNVDTGYHSDFIPGVILVLLLVSVPLSTHSRLLGLLNIGDSGDFKHG